MSKKEIPPIKFYRMKRSQETRFISYVTEHNSRQWLRFFAVNLATRESVDTPDYISRNKTDIIQEISRDVFEYETALIKSEVWEQSNTLDHCQILPQYLSDIIDAIPTDEKLLLYVFTETCGVCKYTSPIVSHLAAQLNNYKTQDMQVLSMYGYTPILHLTGESWIMENPGVPKFYLFTGRGEPKLLHNPDLLGNYNPSETYDKLLALFKNQLLL
ncbi:hypothetical protein C7N43_38155 [Sphingobacteriales bacterium UPWRP_1]|nr:hypothetical protein B6N25_06690 [Sphingobacteriales bacterium TSM_CSS]PSJ71676.1 hypothetical protein C7N43_38155 [Sphingobacteriales bacterium UPWRP_1]